MLLRLAILFLAVVMGQPALAERKAALLIGNAGYAAPATVLKNPPNDITTMKATLEGAGFDVTVLQDAGRAAMSAALAAFEEKATGADIGLIYYSGHGIEVNGDNFLIPVDAKLASDRDVKYETILLDDLLHSLAGATKLKLVLLDACRDNPFLVSMKRLATKGIPARGLARVDSAESNLLIGYATAPGDVALDGEGDNSPYAGALARHLVVPGREVMTAMQAVARDVYGTTKGKQRPFIAGSLFETVMLGPEVAAEVTTTSEVKPTTIDLCRDAATHWNAISGYKDKALLEEHLRLFGVCSFASIAKMEIVALEKSALTISKSSASELLSKTPEILTKRIRAAEAGDVIAMLKVANFYENGIGVPADNIEAMGWYLKAANAGDVRAMFKAAFFYKKGIGVASDYRMAMRQGCQVFKDGNASGMMGSKRFPGERAALESICLDVGN